MARTATKPVSADSTPASTSEKKGRGRKKGGVKIATKSLTKGAKKVREVKKRPKQPGETFGKYIYKVHKQVWPGKSGKEKLSFSCMGISVMNSLVNDMYERILTESAKMLKWSKKKTLSSREIQTACKLILPGIYAHTHTHPHTNTATYTHPHTHVATYTHAYTHTCTHTKTYTHTRVHTQTHTHTHTHTGELARHAVSEATKATSKFFDCIALGKESSGRSF